MAALERPIGPLQGDVVPPKTSPLVEPPRYLTELELDTVVGVLPRVAAATTLISITVRQEIQNKLRLQLSELQVCPAAIPKLKGWVINQFVRSAIHPGEPIGLTTAEATGAPMTQMTLNTFHQTGSAKSMSMGIEAFRELFNATPRRRNENTTIHFKNKDMSFDEVLELRRSLVGVSIGDLVKSYRLEDTATGTLPLEQRGWWYNMYHNIMGKEFIDSRVFLRLELNTTLMYTYKVSLNDVAVALENNEPKVLRCVASPSALGIVDIYPDERVIRKTLTDWLGSAPAGITDVNASILFMQRMVAPQLSSFILKGIKGITKLFPVEETTWSIVHSEEPYWSEERLNAHMEQQRTLGQDEDFIHRQANTIRLSWKLNLDIIRMRIKGIGVAKLRRLLELAGIHVQRMPTDTSEGAKPPPGENRRLATITMPEGWSIAYEDDKGLPINRDPTGKPLKPTPSMYINELIQADERRVEATLAEQRQPYLDRRDAAREEHERNGTTGPLPDVPFFPRIPTPLMRAGTYVYAEANGINLRAVLAHSLVDRRRSISNNLHEILAVLGVEACRSYIAREFYEMVTGNGAYVNSRYIALIADFMTNLGLVVPITSRGVARQQRGAFADASFEHPVEIFIKAAIAGRWEEVLSTSAAIFMGKRALIGTGAMSLGLIEEAIKAIEARAVAAAPRAPTIEVVKQDVATLVGDLTFATDIFNFDESAGATVDSILQTPDPNGPNVVGAIIQAPPRAIGGEAVMGLPLPEEEPVVVIKPKLLAPKGPIPKIRVSLRPLPSWVQTIMDGVDEQDNGSDLPSLSGMDFGRFAADAINNLIEGEQDVDLLDLNTFLA